MADDGRATAAPGADTAGDAPVAPAAVPTAVPAAVAPPPWAAAPTSPVSPFATAASLAQAAARAGPAPGALGALPPTAAMSFASDAAAPERTLKSTLAAAVARHELGMQAALARAPPLGNDATMADPPLSASDDESASDDADGADDGANRDSFPDPNPTTGNTPSKNLLPPGVPPPGWMLDAAWANHSSTPLDAAVDGVAAAREAWICCDAADCGKWRRVPSVVARALGEGDEWRCSENRDERFAGCGLPQELGDDEIDRRVNDAAAAERAVLLAEAEAERVRLREVERRDRKTQARPAVPRPEAATESAGEARRARRRGFAAGFAAAAAAAGEEGEETRQGGETEARNAASSAASPSAPDLLPPRGDPVRVRGVREVAPGLAGRRGEPRGPEKEVGVRVQRGGALRAAELRVPAGVAGRRRRVCVARRARRRGGRGARERRRDRRRGGRGDRRRTR
jgi:hypothetical protein